MRPGLVLFGMAVALAGCSAEIAAPVDETVASEVAASPKNQIQSAAALAGAYRIAGLDGAEFDRPFGAALTIAADSVTLEAQCAVYDWRFRMAAGEMRLALRDGPKAECLANPELDPVVASLAQAIGSAKRAERTSSNGIVISGQGRGVTLYSQ